ncbi:tetratricopeptide repeat protein [Streptococcus didelphis]|uniref:Tetratricopeptide repeat protein n=1 Tax=Streptococcus didelphis TaxID=102886 RepID=A0ABY9LH61_9STRE|nr:CDC27 family protein [Streptococcus didelphis]WMB28150.1 tetratricopeptide repeat protein [Streptococcus didelphis]WMB30072.1 tetratricopeptide repeat protein [Streptococcus didelphis]
MSNSEKMIASLDQKDLQRAEKYFKKALKYDDNEALLSLAEYLESIGFLTHAKEIYLQLKDFYPEVVLNLAQIVAEDNLIEEAFLYLDQIPKTSPYYVNALLVMADLYDLEGLTDVAREKLVEASQLNQDPLILFGLAEIELDLDHFKEAISIYASLDNREILTLTGVSTYQRIGRAYASLGKFEVAIEFLEKSISINYEDDTVYELATILYDQDNYQKANFYFKQLETMNEDYPGYEYIYAQSLHKEHKTKEALRLVQQALRKNEFDSQLLLLASQLAYELHDINSSEAYLLKAKAIAEDSDTVNMRLSTLYLNTNSYEKVIALDNEDNDNLLTQWNIAKAYQALDQEDKAFSIYQAIKSDLGENPEFLYDYAYILKEFGQMDKVKVVAEKYLQLVPDDINMQTFIDELD